MKEISKSYSNQIVERIRDLYVKGYSGNEIKRFISEEYNKKISSAGIIKKLKKEGVKIRDSKEATILYYRNKQPISDIIKLYEDGISMRKLSSEFNIGRRTIRKILIENKISVLNSRSAQLAMGYIKEKNKFVLSPQEMAYLYGLVLGDLTPVRKSNYTLKLITHSTHKTFMGLLQRIFEKYGPTNYKETKNPNMFRFQSHLDLESFSFLLDSKNEFIPNWINLNNFFDFLAGLIDSDGSIIVKHAGKYFQFVIKICGENLVLLKEIKTRLDKMGYYCSLTISGHKGDTRDYNGKLIRYNKDYYNLDVSSKENVLQLLNFLPIRHPEKISKKNLIYEINKNKFILWNDVKGIVKSLKELIKESVILKKDLNSRFL